MTAILQAAGSKTVQSGDKKVARRRLLAEMLWQAVTEARITLPNGNVLEVGGDDWWDNVQFLYKQIDGPPPQSLALTGENGGPIEIRDYREPILRKLLTPEDDTSADND